MITPPDRPRFPGRSCATIVAGAIIGDALAITAAIHFNAPLHDRPYINIPLAFFVGGAAGGIAGGVINGIINPRE